MAATECAKNEVNPSLREDLREQTDERTKCIKWKQVSKKCAKNQEKTREKITKS